MELDDSLGCEISGLNVTLLLCGLDALRDAGLDAKDVEDSPSDILEARPFKQGYGLKAGSGIAFREWGRPCATSAQVIQSS